MSLDHPALEAMLTRLQLTLIRDQLDSLLDEAAKRELTLREAIAFLCEREVSRRNERRIEMATKIAHFPTLRDLDGFDFAAQPSIDKGQIRELAASRWVAHGDTLLLLGPTESDSYCPPRYAIRMPSHFDADRQTTAAECGADPRRA
jgi:DNA replication protein DnaC